MIMMSGSILCDGHMRESIKQNALNISVQRLLVDGFK